MDVRTLMVLRDTDRDDANLRALDLHDALAAHGAQVRSVALGPGVAGGLDDLVPVLSPSPRSVAAALQLRREARWASVVVFHGRPPVATWSLRRLLGAPVVLVVDASTTAAPAALPGGVVALAVVGEAPDGSGGSDAPAGAGADARVVPVCFGPPVGVAPVGPDRRRAARAHLGLAEDVPAVVWAGGSGRGAAGDGRAACVEAAARLGLPLLVAEGHDEELVRSAADVALLAGSRTTGPPRELLAAAAAGCAVVGPASAFVDDTVGVGLGHGAGVDEVTSALAGLLAPGAAAQRGAEALRRVGAELSWPASLPTWLALLRSASRS